MSRQNDVHQSDKEEQKIEDSSNHTILGKIGEFFSSPAGLTISGVMTGLGVVFSLLGILDVIEKYKIPVITTGLIILTIGILLVVKNTITENIKNRKLNSALKKLRQTETSLKTALKEFDLLVEHATNGMRETFNSVTITYNIEKELYHFEFEKRFIIISESSPLRYPAQFYANKYPTEDNRAKKFYSENKIEWENLNVEATIRYKQPDKQNYTDEIDLIVLNQISNGNLIPFDICFRTKSNNAMIALIKDTEVILKYHYRLQRKFWGTYINRSMTFFNADTFIIIKYDSYIDKKLVYYVSCLDREGRPIRLDREEYIEEMSNNGNYKEIKIKIKNTKPFSRYRVSWEAKDSFGGEEEDTKDGIDQLGATNR